MKTLRALLSALALLALLAIPALAQDESSLTISVSCETDPETVTITNNLEGTLNVVSISSLDDPRENEPFLIFEMEELTQEVAVGGSVTFESGDAADENVLTEQFIFDNEAQDEGVVVSIGPEGITGQEGDLTFEVFCEEGSKTFDFTGTVTPPDNKPGKTPDNQQGGGDMVTKTFTLTLKGDVPEDAIFPVFYATRDQIAADPEDPTIFLFCGQPPTEFGLEPKADCEAGVYTHTVQFEAGTEIALAFARASETDPESFEFFHQSFDGEQPSADDPGDFETLNTDFTNSAWFTFTAGDDQQGKMPAMPNTGAGGIAGSTLPIGQLAGALSLAVGYGYFLMRRRT